MLKNNYVFLLTLASTDWDNASEKEKEFQLVVLFAIIIILIRK